MASEAIVELIAQDLVAVLQAVSVDRGDFTTLSVFRSDNQPPPTPRDGLCVVTDGDAESLTSPYGHAQWMQMYDVTVFRSRSQNSPESVQTSFSNTWGDVSKAVKVDATRGGYAIYTYVDAPTRIADGEFDRISIPVRVMYRTLINNPFTQ